MKSTHPTTWIVALVNPEGEPEAWLTLDRKVTPARWDAARFATRAEADAVALVQNGHDRRLLGLDGRRWASQAEVVEVVA